MAHEIAVIGAGIMGSAIATRLLDCGHSLHVFDIDAAKVAALAEKGAKAAASPAEATKASRFVIPASITRILCARRFSEMAALRMPRLTASC
jgi:6-phosphogluconate dehydrogenase (decarboxylating)